MRRNTILNVSFVLTMIALPLVSVGSVNDQALLWQLGLLLLMVGLLIPPALRLRKTIQDMQDEPDVGESPS